jgi:Raf kinase inhibitor-like YbhB/YbcL family protein
MEVKSTAFKHEGHIPSRYTCNGENINPPIEIMNIAKNARYLALVMDDPDAPNKTWVHWLIWNISVEGSSFSIEENNPPKDCKYGKNDFDKLEYGGPCPPSGTHRYYFKVYALDSKLTINEGASKDELMNAIKKNKIESAELIGLYP